ncbi:MAG: tetratricopeptide repeat protein, partial [Desulfobacterales bacterium]|nr:tetratricopeptide repeat protein [Desulfobacterales bacterium]
MVNAKTDFRVVILVSLCLIVAIIIAYVQVNNFDFVGYDDQEYVTENIQVQKGLSVEGIIWTFTTFHSANWHPLTWLSHMLDCELYGLNPMGHHWTNLIIHMANTILLFLVLKLMTGAIWRSAFVAALFALHPLHVESVAWVSERKDVLSTFFGLLTMGAYYYYVKTSGLKNYLLVIIFLSLGLMAKPMLVTFPFVLLLLDFWPLKRFQLNNDRMLQTDRVTFFGFQGFFRLLLEKIPLVIPVVISCILTFLAQKNYGAVQALEALPLINRIANALISYSSYVLKMIWPSSLAVFYPYSKDLPLWKTGMSCLLLLSVFVFVFRTMKAKPYLLVGWLWYIGTLVPVIGLVQVGEQAMADRYTYIPLIGLFIMVSWGMSDLTFKWHYRKIFLGVCAMIILAALTASTFFQTGHWKNGITLFENAIKVSENNYKAQNNLGAAFSPVDLDKAIFHFKEALKIKPDYVMALYNLGTALSDKGNYDEAGIYFAKALKINPQKTDARNNLANILFLQGKLDEAVSLYNEALKINPEHADAHYNLAYVMSSQGKLDEAVLHYKEAIRINPEYAKAHYHLGKILINQKKMKEAMFHFA